MNVVLACCASFRYETSSVSLVVAAPVVTGIDDTEAGCVNKAQPQSVVRVRMRTARKRDGIAFM